MRWNFSKESLINTSGDYPHQDSTQRNRPMRLNFRGLSVLSHMHAFGKLGHLPNVDSLCGWLPTIDVGLQIGWLGEVSRILLDARFATKKKRTFSTSSLGVFARQFWYSILHYAGLSVLAPQPSDTALNDWWRKVENCVDSEVRKGQNSFIILGAWTIWRHRNDCVFNGASPRLGTALVLAKEEALLWSLARAKGLPPPDIRGVG